MYNKITLWCDIVTGYHDVWCCKSRDGEVMSCSTIMVSCGAVQCVAQCEVTEHLQSHVLHYYMV